MKKKIAYAVFTKTDSGQDYMVKGNFGSDKKSADKWKKENELVGKYSATALFVKKIEY